MTLEDVIVRVYIFYEWLGKQKASNANLTRERGGERKMRFVQFRQSNDDKEAIRVGIQKESGNLVDLSHALPNCRHLVDALAKFGIQGVIDAAQSRYFTQ